ncbi:DUF2835 family protein [uncultured Shewanella sp.]|uniref:DUF2835 family protein n=1 Tax=uncultured Shewanella sp. TaxID=173975 RepID=UPI00260F2A58|nr:DUF2835 family protein [uncultured Shewanella sp.]
MRTFIFNVNLSYQEFMPYYQGKVNNIEVRDGKQVIWINGRHFRPFLSLNGVNGLFKLTLNQGVDIIALNKLE